MREELKQEVRWLLSNYLSDLNYWCSAYTVDDVNSVTNSIVFKDEDAVKAYRDEAEAILKALRDED